MTQQPNQQSSNQSFGLRQAVALAWGLTGRPLLHWAWHAVRPYRQEPDEERRHPESDEQPDERPLASQQRKGALGWRSRRRRAHRLSDGD